MNGPLPIVGLAEQDWTPATAAEACLAFLRAEWDKEAAITGEYDKRLIDNPDLGNPAENRTRRIILGTWREPLLQRIPANTEWYRVWFLTDDHVNQLLVIAIVDWVDPRDRNELRRVAVRRPQILRTAPADWPHLVLWSHTRVGPFSQSSRATIV